MEKSKLLEIVREAGFENLDDFIKANLCFLPEDKQRLFTSVAEIEKS